MFLALLRSVVRGLGLFGVRAIADSGRSGYGGLQRLIWLCAIVVGLDNQVVFCHPAAMPETYRRNGGPERTFYPGGKNGSGVYQRIINLMPPHRVYIEPFLGGGAIFRLKKPAEVNIGLDLDQD